MDAFDVLTLVGCLGSAVVGGIFFIFSACVMKALGSLPPAHGIAAMQTINIVIINGWFLSVFVGTAGVSVLTAFAVFLWPDSTGVWPALAGSALYFIGVFLVTMRGNVPRNDALARVAPESEAAARVWADYLSTWTWWNHVRTAAALAAAFAFAIPRWLAS